MTIFEQADQQLLPDFHRQIVTVNGNDVLAVIGGSGPPLLMLHGDPQTHLCWHLIAPQLTEQFTVILTDIRGRGETHKPPHDSERNAYSKRYMASEQVAVMKALGYSRFSLVGHDRGGRVARRIALDYPSVVEQLIIMDIIPALDFYEQVNSDIAQDYFYFFFLTQPHPLPELLINGDPERFMMEIPQGLSDSTVPYDDNALKSYLTSASTPESVIAMCECFRAGITIDCVHDTEDRMVSKTIDCPTLIMWGERGVVGKHFDVRAIWDKWCTNVQYKGVASGHFIPEEDPDTTLKVMNKFLVIPNT